MRFVFLSSAAAAAAVSCLVVRSLAGPPSSSSPFIPSPSSSSPSSLSLDSSSFSYYCYTQPPFFSFLYRPMGRPTKTVSPHFLMTPLRLLCLGAMALPERDDSEGGRTLQHLSRHLHLLQTRDDVCDVVVYFDRAAASFLPA